MPHTPRELPTGPARVRCSDADRDGVTAQVRHAFDSGRLREDEFEERLGRALSAATVGQLRAIVKDLPARPATRGERLRDGLGRAARRVAHWLGTGRRKAWAAGGLFALFAVIGAATSPENPQATPASPPSVPDITNFGAVPAPPTNATHPQLRITRAKIGQATIDDGMAFQVIDFRIVQAIPRTDGSEYRPGPNQSFIVADVSTTNRAGVREDPACAYGAQLTVRGGQTFDPLEDMYKLAGNETLCAGGLAPGGSATLHYAFEVPRGDSPAAVNLWNEGSPADPYGEASQIRVSAGS